jgi:hypothetical protein
MNQNEAKYYRTCLASGLLSNEVFKEIVIDRIEHGENENQLYDLCTSKDRNTSIEILSKYDNNYDFEIVKSMFYKTLYENYDSAKEKLDIFLEKLYWFACEYQNDLDQEELGWIHSIDDELRFLKPEIYGDEEQKEWMFKEFIRKYMKIEES